MGLQGCNFFDQTQSEGQKNMHHLIQPDYTLQSDEVGGNTNQEGDDHICGMKFMTALDKIPTTGTADINNQFTVM